jgi:hypothetical protein
MAAVEALEFQSIAKPPRAKDAPAASKAEENEQMLASYAYMIEHVVVDADGKQVLTAEEARAIVDGNERVMIPILNAAMGFRQTQKKSSPKPSDSSIA